MIIQAKMGMKLKTKLMGTYYLGIFILVVKISEGQVNEEIDRGK
jgi:hypothetical protein